MKKRLLSLAMALAMCLSLLPAAVFAADSGVVSINENTFPDPVFRDFVKDLPGGDDGKFTAEELAAITEINIRGGIGPEGKMPASLKGIEYFTNLKNLDCGDTLVTELDVSKNLALERLICSYTNMLTTLELGNLPALEYLDCCHSHLAQLNVTGLPALKALFCDYNQLTELDLRSNPALYSLNCNVNLLTELDLSNVLALNFLYCADNRLSTLKLGDISELQNLNCSYNRLTELNLNGGQALTFLQCSDNLLTELDLSQLPKLSLLILGNNELAGLDLSNNSKLRHVSCLYNSYFLTDSTSLSDLPGFDLSKVSNVRGGSFEGDKITFTDNAITYDYDTGWTSSSQDVNPVVTFTLRHAFTDVPSGTWYTSPVRWAVNRGITSGMTETTFGPTALCNRAQIVTFLWKIANCPMPESTENPFTDVPEDAWYTKAVLWAVESGITSGMTETTFGPTATCNRAQAMTFLWKFMQAPKASEVLPFTDVPEDAWYYKAVQWAVVNDITDGLTPAEFGPTVPCNRAQIVTFLYKADHILV